MDQNERFVRVREAAQRLGCSVRTVYRIVAMGQLPQPRKVGVRCSGWPESIIVGYLDSVDKGRDR